MFYVANYDLLNPVIEGNTEKGLKSFSQILLKYLSFLWGYSIKIPIP